MALVGRPGSDSGLYSDLRRKTGMITSELVLNFLQNYYQCLEREEENLNRLDSVVGDGEHGFNLRKSYGQVIEKLPELNSLALPELLKKVGMTLLAAGGGTSATLYGFSFMKTAELLPNVGTDFSGSVAIFRAILDMMKERGKARPGDKTMIDAFEPAVTALEEAAAAGVKPQEAYKKAADFAEKGAEATREMIGKMGRALYAGERGLGTIDPGAASTALFFKTIAESI